MYSIYIYIYLILDLSALGVPFGGYEMYVMYDQLFETNLPWSSSDLFLLLIPIPVSRPNLHVRSHLGILMEAVPSRTYVDLLQGGNFALTGCHSLVAATNL